MYIYNFTRDLLQTGEITSSYSIVAGEDGVNWATGEVDLKQFDPARIFLGTEDCFNIHGKLRNSDYLLK